MMTFPNIPVSVTINDYVDIAKLYSTYKSGGYINGMLDSIARNLIRTGRLMKHIDPVKNQKYGKEKTASARAPHKQGKPTKTRPRIKKEEPTGETISDVTDIQEIKKEIEELKNNK